MAFFDDLTTSLKQNWLQFFQENRSWLKRQMEIESVNTPDGGRRPPSYLILGVANSLEPELRGLMLPFTKLNPDVNTLIDALELNFDPDLMLGNSSNPTANPELPSRESSEFDAEMAPMLQEPTYNVTVIETMTLEDSDELNVMSLDDIGDEVVLVESDDESMVIMNVSELDELNEMSFDEIGEEVVLVESDDESMVIMNVSELDELNDMLLDDTDSIVVLGEPDQESTVIMNVSELDELNDMLLDDTDSVVVLGESDQESRQTPSAADLDMFGDDMLLNDEMADVTSPLESDKESVKPSAAQPNDSDNVLSNLWGEETLADSDPADDKTPSKNDKQSEHDQEISRLFPNF